MTREEIARLRELTVSDRVDGGQDLSAEELKLLAALLDEHDATPSKLQWDLLVALRQEYPDDPSAPGIITSCLGPQSFYGAIHRFREAKGQGRQVVVGFKGASFTNVIRGLDAEWQTKLAQEKRAAWRGGKR